MTTKRPGTGTGRGKIHGKYRRLLRQPGLTAGKIEQMRKHVILLAQTICEHVWRRRFY
jgi:hypothetical protein